MIILLPVPNPVIYPIPVRVERKITPPVVKIKPLIKRSK